MEQPLVSTWAQLPGLEAVESDELECSCDDLSKTGEPRFHGRGHRLAGVTYMWERLCRHSRQHGVWSTAKFLMRRVFRRWDSVIYDAALAPPRPCPVWRERELLQIIGPENLDSVLTPELACFLGGEEAKENLDSVREGDRLFLVRDETAFLHCGYIFFRTRQSKILREDSRSPIIGCCRTASFAQGRGIYRRALTAELCYLKQQGYERAVIETHPDNLPSRKAIEAAGFDFRRQASSWILFNKLVLQRAIESARTRWCVFVV